MRSETEVRKLLDRLEILSLQPMIEFQPMSRENHAAMVALRWVIGDASVSEQAILYPIE